MAKNVKKMASPDFNHALTPMLLGQAIKARRTQHKLRIEDAAALCGIAKQTYMKIEHGQSTVQFGYVLQVCAALGVKLFIKSWQNNDEASDDWK